MSKVRQGKATAAEMSLTALLIIDMFSDFSRADVAPLAKRALRTASTIKLLRQRAHSAGIPIVYINDDFERWRSDREEVLAKTAETPAGRAIVRALRPHNADYFILKPKHSAFYSTPLESLLQSLHVRTLILTGLTSSQCVLFSAMDAYVRDYRLVIPDDCLVSIDKRDTAACRHIFRARLKADTRKSTGLKLKTLSMRSDGSR